MSRTLIGPRMPCCSKVTQQKLPEDKGPQTWQHRSSDVLVLLSPTLQSDGVCPGCKGFRLIAAV